jgi:hypothetical protein
MLAAATKIITGAYRHPNEKEIPILYLRLEKYLLAWRF